MSNSLKAGFSIMQSFESIVKEGQNPIAQEFGVFLHQTRVGVRFEEALRQLEHGWAART
jgi:tight adherence protein B